MRSERLAASAITRSSSAISTAFFWSMLSTSRVFDEAMRSASSASSTSTRRRSIASRRLSSAASIDPWCGRSRFPWVSFSARMRWAAITFSWAMRAASIASREAISASSIMRLRAISSERTRSLYPGQYARLRWFLARRSRRFRAPGCVRFPACASRARRRSARPPASARVPDPPAASTASGASISAS